MPYLHNFGLKDGQVVVFVDILGFKEAILKNENTTMNSEGGLIINDPIIFNTMKNNYPKEYQASKNFKYLWVSDSVVMTTEVKNIDTVLSELCKILNIFYCSGFALRGAITVGKLFHEENIWGPAFVWAVEYEKRAMFPRIVIKKDDFDKLSIGNAYLEFFKVTEQTSFFYFDYFDYFISTSKGNSKDIFASLNVYSRFINMSLKKAKDDKTIGKYIWLANSLKESIIKHSSYIDKMKVNHHHSDLLDTIFNGLCMTR